MLQFMDINQYVSMAKFIYHYYSYVLNWYSIVTYKVFWKT